MRARRRPRCCANRSGAPGGAGRGSAVSSPSMSDRARSRVVLALLLLFAAVTFLIGINWGLPSRAIDPFLFGDQQPWTGGRIAQLAPPEDESRGADVDANPLTNRMRPIWLN